MADGKCSIVVLVSGSGSNLQALLDRQEELGYVVSAVISNRPEANALRRVAGTNVEAVVLDHKTFESRESFDEELAEKISSFRPDLVILAGFMRILSSSFVKRFRGRLLNIHPSLLPKYAGIHTHQRALDAGDSWHGVSVHFVTEELDGGPVIAQSKLRIEEQDTAETLAARVLIKEHQLYPLVTSWFAQGRLKMCDRGAELDATVLPESGIEVNFD